MLYFVIGCLIIGLFVAFSIGWWCGERHVRRNTMVDIPSTSNNNQSMPFHTGYGDGNYNGFGV